MDVLLAVIAALIAIYALNKALAVESRINRQWGPDEEDDEEDEIDVAVTSEDDEEDEEDEA